ncbi:MAG: hypothetical protein NZ805_02915 [Armatimonadetes bacterium]|nr:hypothetical protein [Armatimonadota bacterium]MDW8027784.1 hypothetical protein [Armatimonadota bacterium]
MAESQKANEVINEREDEALKDTGVLIYHVPTGNRCQIRAKVQKGSGRISVNGVPIFDLMEAGKIRKTDELIRVINRERLKNFDIDLDVGDALSTDIFSPTVLAYAFAEALTNLLGRL